MNDELIKDWWRHSSNDLISAKHLFYDIHPKQTEIACFLSQQCAEKALKAYIVFHDEEPEWTHNLTLLCQKCMSYDKSFSDIIDNCAELLPFAVAVRYPNELCPDEYIAKRAIKNAQKIYDFCLAKLGGCMGE